MFFFSVFSIYLGSTRCLLSYEFTARRDKKHIGTGRGGKFEDEKCHISLESEGLIGVKQLFSIPILSSLVLLLTYFFIKQQVKLFNDVLYLYFLFSGVLAMKKYFYAFLQRTNGFTPYDSNRFKLLGLEITLLEIVCLLFAAYIGYGYHETQFWIGNNIFALCLTCYAIESWLCGEFRLVALLYFSMVRFSS